MATTSKAIKLNDNFPYGGTGYLNTSEDYMNVYATWETPYNSYVYARMTLQRYEGGAWKNIETKGAYAYYTHQGRKHANVQFTNIAKKNAKMRVKINLHDGNNPSSPSMQTAYGATWTR